MLSLNPKANSFDIHGIFRLNGHDFVLIHIFVICRVRILARILAKCELKKQLARWYFLYLHFLASKNFWPVIRGSIPRYKSSLQFP